MKKIVAIAVLTASSWSADACDKFTVLVYPFDVYENTSLTAAEINARFREPGSAPIVSYIKAKPGIGTDPKRCTLTVGYADPTLYVASEANENECMKRRVFAQERERLKIYERFVKTLPSRVSAAAKPYKEDLVGGPKPELRDALFAELLAYESELEANDAAYSYRTLPYSCDGVLSRVIPH